ncbi:hypothetical protein FA15DRAFT_708478 [Coprinopsis marcescibilis]|uniref:Uncharacterized protein n=1 Tax=Coprinopsis marcescibilis TaxID=230819 RepID=A0A5C3KIX2_COPMA|nr:hypothetical protein FA15DRAFT_708478 [Coprinopsis marcescibilis]
MGHRVISNLEFRCWAACPSSTLHKYRSSSTSKATLVISSQPSPPLPRYEDMGFFSTRKPDETNGTGFVTVATTSHADKSVVQVIRSRFYGKKGKEREVEQLPYSSTKTSSRQNGSVVTPMLSPASAPNGASIGASPRPSTSQRNPPPTPASILQKSYADNKSLPPTPTKSRTVEVIAPSGSSASVRSSRRGPSTPSKSGDTTIVLSPTPQRKHADSVTVTLAQRLNELAVANSEGLLNDDEYRLLRQSLFDRFATAAVVPQEESIVPATRPRPRNGSNADGRTTLRPLSNFQVEVPRPSSIHSRNSMSFGGGVADLIRRATGRRSSSATSPAKDSDASSVWSGKSSSSKIFRFRPSISKKSSNSSINTTVSRAQADTISISSKRGASGSDKGHSDSGHFSSSGNRSTTGSIRKLQTPPSSFPTRVIGSDTRYATSIRDVFDEDNLKTAQDVQREIQAVEAEQRRLMDAFNGLELTTLSKARRHHPPKPSLKSADLAKGSSQGEGSQWTARLSDTRSQRRLNPSESDVLSIRSGVSVGTAPSVAPSMARSAISSRSKSLRAKGSHILSPNGTLASPASLQRKNSSSSFTSTDRRHEKSQMQAPPVPALPAAISHGHLRAMNNSSISLVRSTGHLPMDVVHEDEDARIGMEDEAENEMDDIRRRREEVALRYEARLDYLRAKLKGAQLHEKLMKK